MMQRLKMVLVFGFLTFWILSFDLESWKWSLGSLVLFNLPLLTIQSQVKFRFFAFLAFLMVVQALGGRLLQKVHHHLTPNLSMKFEVQGLKGMEGVQSVSTDEKGFRVLPPFNYSEKKEARVLALGASTTEQIYLGDEKTWTAHLERAFDSRIKVINAGVSGLSIPRIYENLKYGVELKPEVVLILVGVNDWMLQVRRQFEGDLSLRERGLILQRDFGLEALQLKRTPLVQLGYLLRDRISKTASHKVESKIVYGERLNQEKNSLGRRVRFKYFPQKPSVEFEKYMSLIIKECKTEKIKCYFLTQPYGYHRESSKEYLASLWMTPADTSYTLDLESVIHMGRMYNEYIRVEAAKNSLPVCELEDKVEQGFHSFYDDVHFNIAGAARVGKKVAECIASEFKVELKLAYN